MANRDKDKRHPLTKEETQKGNKLSIASKRLKYVDTVKMMYYDILLKLLSYNLENPSDIPTQVNKELLEYIMEKYHLSEQTAADYIGKTKTLALINVNTSEFAQKVLRKNFIRLEQIAEKAYEEDDTNLQLKVIDMENKLFQLYQKPTLEIETNPQEGTTRFRINLGGEDN